MNPGGDAAEQVVRISLEGMEYAIKISGAGAKELAVIIYATLKQEQKTMGKARLSSMLRSGKPLKIYTITQKDLPKFAKEAKRYGVLYCVLKDRANSDPDAEIDIIARVDDAPKISRIHERFELSAIAKEGAEVEVESELNKVFPLNPSLAKTERDPLSEPDFSKKSNLTGPTGTRPSVREKLNDYKSDISRAREATKEKTREAVSRMPVPKPPGKER